MGRRRSNRNDYAEELTNRIAELEQSCDDWEAYEEELQLECEAQKAKNRARIAQQTRDLLNNQHCLIAEGKRRLTDQQKAVVKATKEWARLRGQIAEVGPARRRAEGAAAAARRAEKAKGEALSRGMNERVEDVLDVLDKLREKQNELELRILETQECHVALERQIRELQRKRDALEVSATALAHTAASKVESATQVEPECEVRPDEPATVPPEAASQSGHPHTSTASSVAEEQRWLAVVTKRDQKAQRQLEDKQNRIANLTAEIASLEQRCASANAATRQRIAQLTRDVVSNQQAILLSWEAVVTDVTNRLSQIDTEVAGACTARKKANEPPADKAAMTTACTDRESTQPIAQKARLVARAARSHPLRKRVQFDIDPW